VIRLNRGDHPQGTTMLQDGLLLLDTATAVNFQIQNGGTLPASGNNVGELFYLTGATPGLHVYDGAAWQPTNAVNVAGLNAHETVRVATTGNIASLSGLLTVDGVTLVDSDRVLVKNQSTGSQNGIYVAAAGAWSRAADFDGSPSNEVTSGDFMFVSEGTLNADTGWILSNDGPITIDSTALVFTKFSSGAGATPGGSNTHVQYNNAGAFAGNAGFTFTEAGSVLSLGELANVARLNVFSGVISSGNDGGTGGPLTVRPNSSNGNNGFALNLLGGNAGGQAGGYVYVTGANEASAGYGGGNVVLKAGDGVAGGPGPSITVQGAYGTGSNYGTGPGTGAAIFFNTGTSTSVERLAIYNNGAWALGGTIGTAGQVITSNGSASAPTWQTPSVPAAAAGTLTGTTLASNVVASSLTSVGTLSTVTVSGNTNLRGPVFIGLDSDAGVNTFLRRSNTSGNGGAFQLTAGQGLNQGGNMRMDGGATFNGTGATGGNVLIAGGVAQAGGTGGYVQLATSPSTAANEVTRLRITHQGAWQLGASLLPGTSGQVLTSTGSTTAPTWQTVSVAGSALTGASLASGIVSSSLTSLGTIASLVVTNAQLTGTLTTGGTVGTSGQVLTSNGVGVNPTWQNPAALDADLVAIAALAGTSGLLRKTALDTWSLDTASYLTANQTITLSGDISGSGTTAITGTLATVNSNVGTFGTATAVPSVTVNAKGLVTGVTATTIAIPTSAVTSGTFADARIAASNVTQHQAALTILESQITDGSLLARNAGNETISGTWTFSNAVTIPVTPTAATHAASKSYVDEVASGMNVHNAVRVATTAALTATYDNGTAGVGATLTGTGALPSIDGVSLAVSNRVLVKNQGTTLQNGIYDVTQTTSNWVLTRAADFDNSPANEVTAGDATYVQEGTQAGSQWVQTTAGSITIGTSPIVFTQFGAASVYFGGAGMTLDGGTGTFNVGTASASRIVVNADDIDLATVGTAGTYKSVTTDAYGRVTAGTNPTTLSGFGIVDAQPLDADLTAIAALAGTSGLLRKTAADTWALDTTAYSTTTGTVTSIQVDGDTTGLTFTGGPITTSGTLTLGGTLAVANGGTGVTTATGTGSVVRATSPTITTPTLYGTIQLSNANTFGVGVIREWDTADTDIDGLLAGSTGLLIESRINADLTIGIRSNGVTDSFNIVSYGVGPTSYTIKAFEVRQDGNMNWAGVATGDGSGITALNANNVSAGVLAGAQGGTGVSNSGKTITLGGNLETTGAFNTTFAQGASVTLTLPTTSSTLATTGNLSQFASTTSAQLAGIISDETGTGSLVFSDAPTFTGIVQASAITMTSNLTQSHAVQNITAPAAGTTGTLHQFAHATYRSGSYQVQITAGSIYEVLQLMVVHNGTDAFVTELGRVSTSTPTGTTFNASISGANVVISWTGAVSVTIKSQHTLFTV
jgi:hypothetical protein